MSISNFNRYYKYYKKYLKNVDKKNIFYKPLVKNVLKKSGGRNNNGFITAYHRGGGVKRLFRNVCFNYIDILNLGYKKWIVLSIEYDNNRSANIALLKKKRKIFLKKKKMIF